MPLLTMTEELFCGSYYWLYFSACRRYEIQWKLRWLLHVEERISSQSM